MAFTKTIEVKKKKDYKKYKPMTAEEKKNYYKNKKEELTKFKKDFVKSLVDAAKEGKEFSWQSPNFIKYPKSLARLEELEEYNQKHPDNQKQMQNVGYRGMNILILCKAMDDKGFTDSRWATWQHIRNNKGHVKAGEKATIILKADYRPKKELNPETGKKEIVYEKNEKTGEYLRDKEGKLIPVMQAFVVKLPMFNVEQTEGLDLKPEPPMRILGEKDKCPEMESIIDHSEAKVYLDQGSGLDRYYMPGKDEIHLPPRGHFKSMSAFYATAAHEIAHSTGSEKRLNRDMGGNFGSPSYAREEMVAELTSVFLSQELNIKIPQAEVENHMAYIQSWNEKIKLLTEKPEEFFKVISDAEKATEYIKSHMMEKDLQQQQETGLTEINNKDKSKEEPKKKEQVVVKPKGIKRKPSNKSLSR